MSGSDWLEQLKGLQWLPPCARAGLAGWATRGYSGYPRVPERDWRGGLQGVTVVTPVCQSGIGGVGYPN